MLAALAFVPKPDVIIAFEAVSEDFTLDGQAVIDYFEDTYIGRLRPGNSFSCFRRSYSADDSYTDDIINLLILFSPVSTDTRSGQD